MSPEEIKRLRAHELHEVAHILPVFDVTITHDSEAGTILETEHMTAQIMPHYYTGLPALTIVDGRHASMEIGRIDELIALLTEARRIMQEGR